MMTAALFRLVFSLQLGVYASSQTTDPPVATNGGTVDLPAVENATNVSVFCEVTFQGSPVTTIWSTRTITSMMVEPIGLDSTDFVFENTSIKTNLTIVSFNRDILEVILLQCGNGFGAALEHAFFRPRFIG